MLIAVLLMAIIGFDPRLRGGGDEPDLQMVAVVVEVSIHASVGEATLLWALRGALAGVSIHASVGEATPLIAGRSPARNVSIHASVGEATGELTFLVTEFKFRSTPPWGRRLAPVDSHVFYDRVSIHASVGEATYRTKPPPTPLAVSIHASVGEATRRIPFRHSHQDVSIHASVGEATAGRPWGLR